MPTKVCLHVDFILIDKRCCGTIKITIELLLTKLLCGLLLCLCSILVVVCCSTDRQNCSLPCAIQLLESMPFKVWLANKCWEFCIFGFFVPLAPLGFEVAFRLLVFSSLLHPPGLPFLNVWLLVRVAYVLQPGPQFSLDIVVEWLGYDPVFGW